MSSIVPLLCEHCLFSVLVRDTTRKRDQKTGPVPFITSVYYVYLTHAHLAASRATRAGAARGTAKRYSGKMRQL